MWSVFANKNGGDGNDDGEALFATVHSMRFAGQTNASNSGSGGMPGNSTPVSGAGGARPVLRPAYARV